MKPKPPKKDKLKPKEGKKSHSKNADEVDLSEFENILGELTITIDVIIKE